jgi:hypothetical protein
MAARVGGRFDRGEQRDASHHIVTLQQQ